jgi:hypothetical protein
VLAVTFAASLVLGEVEAGLLILPRVPVVGVVVAGALLVVAVPLVRAALRGERWGGAGVLLGVLAVLLGGAVVALSPDPSLVRCAGVAHLAGAVSCLGLLVAVARERRIDDDRLDHPTAGPVATTRFTA